MHTSRQLTSLATYQVTFCTVHAAPIQYWTLMFSIARKSLPFHGSCCTKHKTIMCLKTKHFSESILSGTNMTVACWWGEHPFGFSILTAERTYELFTHSYQAGNSLFLGNEQLVNKLKDAELWVSALNAARDIANGKVPVQASTASVPRPACEGNDT